MKNYNFDLNDFFKHFGEELKTIFDEHDSICDNEFDNDKFKSKEKKSFKKWKDGELVKNVEEEWEDGKCIKYDNKIHNNLVDKCTKTRNIPISGENECSTKNRDLDALTKKYDQLLSEYDKLEKECYELREANRRLMEDKKFMTDELSNIYNEIQLCGNTWLKIGEAIDYYNKHTANYSNNDIKTNNKKGE